MAVSGERTAPIASGLLEIEDARRMVLAAVRPLRAESVPLELALGRVLAEELVAEEDVPAFENSAMDGFAVRSEDLAAASAERPALLRVVDESRAGSPARAALRPGEAIAISTGAMLPAGAGAVVRVEDTRAVDGAVEVLRAPAQAENVRRAGEDVRAGQRVLAPGAPLGPAELGVLASLGRAAASCARRPRVSVLVTGDELLGAGESARPGSVRESNSLSVSALARREGAELVSVERVGDDAQETVAALARVSRDADVTIVCGGVSVGVHDHVRPALATLGARQAFWGLALKPGRPTWFGTLEQSLVFGLPGNPVSAMVTFVLLVRPALRRLQGLSGEAQPLTALMGSDYVKPPGRAHALRCRLSAHRDGWHAQPTGAQGSHVLTSMLGADALAIVPTDSLGVSAGERVAIEPLRLWPEALG